jgi:predicted nucleic acid-binding protein
LRILIDADVILDVALDRDPHADAAARVLGLAQSSTVDALVAWHTVSNVYYLLAAAADRGKALGFIRDLSSIVEIAPADSSALRTALSLQMRDFEDAMQVAAALAGRADAIVTRNLRDFRGSPVKAVSPSMLRLP